MGSVTVIGSTPPERYKELNLSSDALVFMLRKMLEIRLFEERVERLFLTEGKLIGPSHLYLGQEAVAVGVINALDKDDWVISNYRGHGHAIARGVQLSSLMAELFGKATGTCKGLSGSMHAATSMRHKIPLASAIVGSNIPIAVGIGLGLQYTKSKSLVAVFFGDGAVNTGAFHEGLNLATIWKLPVFFVCENNLYAEFTPHKATFAGESIAARAASYGMRAFQVFGNDVVSVYISAKKAVEYIRNGGGPVFIEYLTYRKGGHGVYDTGWYRPKEEVEEWMKRDPINTFASNLRKLGVLSENAQRKMEEEIKLEIDAAVDEAVNAPTLPFEDLFNQVYASV